MNKSTCTLCNRAIAKGSGVGERGHLAHLGCAKKFYDNNNGIKLYPGTSVCPHCKNIYKSVTLKNNGGICGHCIGKCPPAELLRVPSEASLEPQEVPPRQIPII